MAKTRTQTAARPTVVSELPGRSADDRTDLMFKALASKTRREILRLLATGAGEGDERCCSAEEVCACVFAERLGIGAPTVSHHMKALIDAGLVTAQKRGLWVHYRLRPEGAAELMREFAAMSDCSRGGCK